MAAPTTTSSTPAPPAERGARPLLSLACSLAVVAAVAAAGSRFTETGASSWYEQLDKPPWNPPSATFGIVWTLLYVMMAVAAWRVWMAGPRRPDVRAALACYGLQLALNLGWSAVFFGAHRPGWAIVEIAALLVAVVATTVLFRRISALAFWLMVPYVAWVLYAASLTIGVAALNA